MLGTLTNAEIEKVLTSNVIGRIGCCDNQKMFVVPVTYAYDGRFIYGHTVEGLKITILRKNPSCCFEVDEMNSISDWRSVIAWGTFEALTGEEAQSAENFLVERLQSLAPSETSHPHRMGPGSSSRTLTQGKNPIIYRIRLDEKTGRFERP